MLFIAIVNYFLVFQNDCEFRIYFLACEKFQNRNDKNVAIVHKERIIIHKHVFDRCLHIRFKLRGRHSIIIEYKNIQRRIIK